MERVDIKTLIKFILIAITLFLISGCTSTSYYEEVIEEVGDKIIEIESEELPYEEPPEEFLQLYSAFAGYAGIRLATEEFLNEFDYVHEMGTYVPGGYDVVLWDIGGWHMFDLVFFQLYDDPTYYNGDFFITPGPVVFSAVYLSPGQAVLFRNIEQNGIFPGHAISFVDTNIQRRYIGITKDDTPQTALPFGFVEAWLRDGLDAENPFDLYDVIDGYAAIRLLTNEDFLSGFEYVHEVDYHPDGGEFWDDLVIWAVDRPLTDFKLLDFRIIGIGERFYVIPEATLFSLDALPPGHAFVIRSHQWGGHWGTKAISFLDTDGQRRYFLIQKDFAIGAGLPWWFEEFWIEGDRWPFGIPPWH